MAEDSLDARYRQEMRQAVLAYLHEHPQAMDSREGIAEWWLMHHRIRSDVAALQMVLDRLVQDGVVEEVRTSHSLLYRLRAADDTTTSS